MAAPKKKVQELFLLSFKNRKRPVSERETSGVASLLNVDEATAKQVKHKPIDFDIQVLEDVRLVIAESLYYNFTEGQLSKFLSGLNLEVVKLITTIVGHYLDEWKAKAITEQVLVTKLR